MHTHMNQLVAQQRNADMQRDAERSRLVAATDATERKARPTWTPRRWFVTPSVLRIRRG